VAQTYVTCTPPNEVDARVQSVIFGVPFIFSCDYE
jgi:hypothetical protein